MITLSIIIVSFNTKDVLRRLLLSLASGLQKQWEVIVVDNHSSDGSQDMVESDFKWVKLIRNRENRGFSAGNNIGLKRAQGSYMVLLNSDTEVPTTKSLQSLLQIFEHNERVGMISPRVVFPSGKIDMACHRGFPSPWNALMYFGGFEKLFGMVPLLNRVCGGYHQTWKSLRTKHDIDACTGAAMLVRSTAIDEVGLFDERFFMYGEDLDWCFRFKKAGWEIMYDPSCTVIHHKNISGIRKEVTSYEDIRVKKRAHAHFFDTMIQFYEKHYLSTYPAWLKSVVYFGIRSIKYMKGA